MGTYKIIKLKNLTPFHIGTGKENYDFSSAALQSDTISSALAALRVQSGKKEDVVAFLNSFTISSAFPFFRSFCFLPRIKGKLNVKVRGSDGSEVRKQLRKIAYLESSLWQDTAKGNELQVDRSQLNGIFLTAPGTAFLQPFKSEVMQRVTIPRADGQDADPFYFDRTYCREDSGLYCLVDAADEVFNEVTELFIQLGEAGIGTDRNLGGGKFEVETGELTIQLPDNPDATVLLSLYIPTPDEAQTLPLSDSKYDLLLRGGYMAGSESESFRHLRKKSVYMFDAGSVFPVISALTGKVVNLMPEWNDEKMHPVYRSGRPFCINIIQ